MITSVCLFGGMNLPFKVFLVLSIIILSSSSSGKSVAKTKKINASLRASIGAVQLASNETCVDTEPEKCQNFDYYCGTRAEYMSKNCKETCRMCIKGDPVIDLSSKCFVNLDKHQETLCLKREWISVCPHTCREFICDDKAQGCGAMVTSGACLKEHRYMTENCKASCGMCSQGDPVMDKTSECNSKQTSCNDPEWQSICPHTCKLFLQPNQPNANVPQTTQPLPQQVGSVVQPQQQVVQPSVQTQMPSQVQLQQTTQVQQPLQQPLVAQPQLSPQVGTQTGTPVQTTQLQTQVQQPAVINPSLVSPAVQPSQVTQATQVQPLVSPVTQVGPQVNPVTQTGTQVAPVTQATQLQPQQTAPQGSPVTQATQLQSQQTAPQVTQTYQVQPQLQQTAPLVDPVTQAGTQVNPITQATQLQQTAQPVQQQVLQPNQGQYPVSQPQVTQPQVNPGQVYQPVVQQPQYGTVGPMKKQTETSPAKGTAEEKTNNAKKMVKKGTMKKDKKMKTVQGPKEKESGENKTKEGKQGNHDLKHLETDTAEENESNNAKNMHRKGKTVKDEKKAQETTGNDKENKTDKENSRNEDKTSYHDLKLLDKIHDKITKKLNTLLKEGRGSVVKQMIQNANRTN